MKTSYTQPHSSRTTAHLSAKGWSMGQLRSPHMRPNALMHSWCCQATLRSAYDPVVSSEVSLADHGLQGAQVVGNILGGQTGGSTGCTTQESTGLDPSTSPGAQSEFKYGTYGVDSSKLTSPGVAAAVFFGDVTHTANQTYNVESGAPFNGVSVTRLFLNNYLNWTHQYCPMTASRFSQTNSS